MAGLRLLALFVLLLASGCVTYTPEIGGRLVDKKTGAPVAGAEVFVMRSAQSRLPMNSGYRFAYRWTTTDADGRFHFAAAWQRRPSPLVAELGRTPGLEMFHPDYGNALDFATPRNREEWSDFTVAIEPSFFWLRYKSGAATSSVDPGDACSTLWSEASDHCCLLVYGNKACRVR